MALCSQFVKGKPFALLNKGRNDQWDRGERVEPWPPTPSFWSFIQQKLAAGVAWELDYSIYIVQAQRTVNFFSGSVRVHGDLVVIMFHFLYCVMWIYIVERVLKRSVFIELNRTVASHCGVCIQAGYDRPLVSLHGVMYSYMMRCTLKVYVMDGVPYRCPIILVQVASLTLRRVLPLLLRISNS